MFAYVVCRNTRKQQQLTPYSPARKAEYQDALILITEKKISSVQQIVPALEIALGMKKSVN